MSYNCLSSSIHRVKKAEPVFISLQGTYNASLKGTSRHFSNVGLTMVMCGYLFVSDASIIWPF
jgi:hypothetical protein